MKQLLSFILLLTVGTTFAQKDNKVIISIQPKVTAFIPDSSYNLEKEYGYGLAVSIGAVQVEYTRGFGNNLSYPSIKDDINQMFKTDLNEIRMLNIGYNIELDTHVTITPYIGTMIIYDVYKVNDVKFLEKSDNKFNYGFQTKFYFKNKSTGIMLGMGRYEMIQLGLTQKLNM